MMPHARYRQPFAATGPCVRLSVLTLLVVLMPTARDAMAGEPVDSGPKSRAASPAVRHAAEDAGQASEAVEQVTLEFVREHQPELGKLLEFLKSRQSADYEKAISESYKVRNRLRSIKDRDPELYAVELDIWKNSAKMRLWAATVSVKNKKLSEQDLESLNGFVARDHELNIKKLELEKTRAEARVSQLSQQLSKRQEQSESMISKAVKSWENRIERSQPKSKNKSAASKP